MKCYDKITKRNYSIDILKGICAVLVVFLHVKTSIFDITILCRCAVPCFFMISGYLLFDKNCFSIIKIRRSIRHILKIILWSTFLFAIVKEGTFIYNRSFYLPSLKDWILCFVLNDNPFAFHLWYLNAYLYVLIIVLLAHKYRLIGYMYLLIPFLLLGDLIFGKYSMLILGNTYKLFVVRNFLFVGLPYFLLGSFVKTREYKIGSINRKYLYGGVILFTITSYIESWFLMYFNCCSPREHYISTTFMTLFLFILILSYNVGQSTWLSNFGGKYSLYVYIIHPLPMWGVKYVVTLLQCKILLECYSVIAPLIVLGITLFIVKILKRYKVV